VQDLSTTDTTTESTTETLSTMHELFLTANIPNDDLSRVVRILQGFCGMNPQAFLCRRLIWEATKDQTAAKGIPSEIIAKQAPAKAPLWKSLHHELARQSYVITLVYDVQKSTFGQSSTQQDGLDKEPQ
jgi:mediator of RNA polymerase II transcription subunit 18, fungi type